ncbi:MULTISPECIES: endonuclease domain-containing protein [unclassified Pseudarthrobacter]|uniref:endonuclease domain-containing protein n=1 Tax=unclassified Pseudarthrobacter TaxID=2647000 RepID=UPI00362D1AEC
MRSSPPLPVHLATKPFTVESAVSANLTRDRLTRADVEHVGRGLFRPSSWSFDLEDAARALSEATPGAWISHVTAARLRNSYLPPWLSDSNELHLSKPKALPGVRRQGICGHRVISGPGEIELVEGIWLSTRARTWLDMARILPLNDLVALGDELIRMPRPAFEGRAEAYTSISDLKTLINRHSNLQGIVRARQALDLMRVGSDSAPETFLRLGILDAGLPDPELQVRLRQGDSRSPSADLGYRRCRIAIQYDGGHHLQEPQRLSDRRRNRAFEAAGWTVLVFDKADHEDNFTTAIKHIKRAIRASTMDPAASAGFARAL